MIYNLSLIILLKIGSFSEIIEYLLNCCLSRAIRSDIQFFFIFLENSKNFSNRNRSVANFEFILILEVFQDWECSDVLKDELLESFSVLFNKNKLRKLFSRNSLTSYDIFKDIFPRSFTWN